MSDVIRCAWAKTPLGIAYHDREWGVPVHNDRRLFEMLVLEGAQAGLSWETILKKRARYREVFDRFDPEAVARYGAREIRALMGDAGIVRNRAKIEAAIANARAFLEVREENGSFDAWIWGFVDHQPIQNARRSLRAIPTETEESRAMSKALRGRGFRFVGPTICYAFMEAVGMVNDHTLRCFRWKELRGRG